MHNLQTAPNMALVDDIRNSACANTT